jgi:CopG family transcriptional regulator, nickel-responsive regulator
VELERVTITMERELVEKLDRMIERSGQANRSEAIRDLVRKRLIEEALASERRNSVATVTLVYDHERRELADRLLEAGHEHHGEILATMHVHLDEHRCLEVVALKGRAGAIRHIANHLIGMKGVIHGELVQSTAEI